MTLRRRPGSTCILTRGRPRRSLRFTRPGGFVALAFLSATFFLVHAHGSAFFAAEAQTAQRMLDRRYEGQLPSNVIEMRDAILAAIESGDIHDLKTAIEWNELRPDFGPVAGSDAIAYWISSSGDGAGREVLAHIANLLSLPPAKIAVGPDAENSAVFVWPYLSELPPESLSQREQVELLRLVSPQAYKVMINNKKWMWWRLAISADGTWLTLRKYD